MSLTAELATIRGAVQAARILADEWATAHLGIVQDEQDAPAAISAVLTLVACRLQDVGRVIQGGLNPAALWHVHNDATGAEEDNDILFGERPGAPKGVRNNG